MAHELNSTCTFKNTEMDNEISGFGLKNFRIFDNNEFEFAPITILTGANNAGKSSLIKALLLVEEYFSGKDVLLNRKIDFSAEASMLGNMDSVKGDNTIDEITFSFPFKFNSVIPGYTKNDWVCELDFVKSEGKNKEVGQLKNLRILNRLKDEVFIEVNYKNENCRVPDESRSYTGKKAIVKFNFYELLQAINNELKKMGPHLIGFTDLLSIRFPENDDNNDEHYPALMVMDPLMRWKYLGENGDLVTCVVDPWESLKTKNVPLIDFFFKTFNENQEMIKKGFPLPIEKIAPIEIEVPSLAGFAKRPTNLLLEYIFHSEGKEVIKKAVAIEKQAMINVSNGICSYADDSEFLNHLKSDDVFLFSLYRFNIENADEFKYGFSMVLEEDYSRLDPNFFILFYHETLYLVKKHGLEEDFEINIDYYYNKFEENPRYFQIDTIDEFAPEITALSSFCNHIAKNILKEIKNAFHFEHKPSVRSKIHRYFHKEFDKSAFLNSINEYYDLEWEGTSEQLFLDFWIKEFSLGEKIIIERKEATVTAIYIVREGVQRNLADLGFGMGQILPVLISVALNARRKSQEFENQTNFYLPTTIIIEEPESNLHPKLQSKLADFLIDAASKYNIRFIIESHSEYLIRKFQYWIARKAIKPDDLLIYYFNEKNNIPVGRGQVEKINILEDGSLDKDFGPGFFDEAINWQFELLRIKGSQKN